MLQRQAEVHVHPAAPRAQGGMAEVGHQVRLARSQRGGGRVRLRVVAPVAQGIEQRFPKPRVACSSHAGGIFDPSHQEQPGGADGRPIGIGSHGRARPGEISPLRRGSRSLSGLLPTLIVYGLGIAAAPWCVIGVIVILGTARPLTNAAAFLGGAVVSMCAVFGICSLVFGSLDLTVHTTPASTTAIVQILVGGVLLAWGAWRWYRRTILVQDSTQAGEPRWLSAIDRVRPLIAFPVGLCMPNPIFAAAGSIAILKADVDTAETVLALSIFILVSLCTLVAPVVVYLRSPDTVGVRLRVWRRWLAVNSSTILTVLLVFYRSVDDHRGSQRPPGMTTRAPQPPGIEV